MHTPLLQRPVAAPLRPAPSPRRAPLPRTLAAPCALARAAAVAVVAASGLLVAAGAAAQDTVPPAPAAVETPAATAIFAGRVLDRATGQPLPGAQVEFPELALRATSDADGAFRVGELAVGQHDLVVLAAGFQPLAVTIAVREGMPSVDISLSPPPADGTVVEFSGRVVDARSAEPIRDARVEFIGPGRPVLSDAQGAFRIAEVAPGPQMLRVRATGYPTVASAVAVEPGMAPAVVEMEPDVVMLEGLRVVADRLEQRRRAAPMSSRVMEGGELARSSAPDMPAFLRQHFGLSESVCGAIGRSGSNGCVMVRGTPETPTIIIDDAPAMGGIRALDLYEPADFERVEVYSGGKLIMLYTSAYIERRSRSRTPWLEFPVGV